MASKSTVADFYTYHYKIPLIVSSDGAFFQEGTQLGWNYVEIQVFKNTDVRNLQSANGYIVQYSQRTQILNFFDSLIIQPNSAGAMVCDYQYLAGVGNAVCLNLLNDTDATIEVIRFSPKTLNTVVQTSSQGASSSDSSTNQESSTGSTQSTVNTFSAGLSGGFFGDSPTGSLSLGYSGSWGRSQTQESSNGSSQSSGTSSSNSDSMSVKDWGCYGSKDLTTPFITWNWSQEVPVRMMDSQPYSFKGNIPNPLPSSVIPRLFPQYTAPGQTTPSYMPAPPSDLSLHGVDLVHKAWWRVDFNGPLLADPMVAFNLTHNTNFSMASHGNLLNAKDLSTIELYVTLPVFLCETESPTMSMLSLSLAPIDFANSESPGTLSCSSINHYRSIDNDNQICCLVSPVNDIYMSCSGFVFTNGELVAASPTPRITIAFKISDLDTNYTLLLSHRLENSATDIQVIWTLNEASPASFSDLFNVTPVQGLKTEGNAQTFLGLRNINDVSSANFYDRLQLGMNVISIEIPSLPAGSVYKLSYLRLV